ncbi:MAG: hypothetical protein AB1324_01045 [Candidatus Micrarchaeota archaeon]
MADEAFRGAIEEAKRLEKRTVEYSPYAGDFSLERTLDLEPKEYVDMNYKDLINLYERSQKIISTTGMGILAKSGEAPAPSAETGEVEIRLREMTTETLRTAEEVAKEPLVIEKEIPAPEPEKAPSPIQFEERPAEKPAVEFEREEKAPPARPAEIPKEERPAATQAPAPERVVVPPALAESPDKAAERRYEQMAGQISEAVGERADEITLKKKMLELTKQLFKEKTTSKREELKLQITVLKNMLAASKGGAAAPRAAAAGVPAAKKSKDEANQKILEMMLATHQGELAQTKDTIVDSYNKQIAGIKKKFYEDISVTEDPARRKQIFEGFVFSVTSLIEQLPEDLERYQEFNSKKHAAELEKVLASLSADDKATRGSVEERLDYVRARYDQEFAAVKGIVGREIENLIEVAGSEIFRKTEEKPGKEVDPTEVVKEINELDEGTLLYYLHSKDPEFYKKYERKALSKAEAIFKAKELMAKEKGMDDAMVKRYFSQMVG